MNASAPRVGKHILVVNGHPDAGKGHFCDALVAAYLNGARSAGHDVDVLNVAELKFPLLASKATWDATEPCADIAAAQLCMTRADHIVMLYPLWLGDMPALLKGFLEQVLRPGFAFGTIDNTRLPEKKLHGKSARIVVTMGMPAFIYRWFYGAHSLKNLKRNILKFCGITPVRSTLIGMIESQNPRPRRKALNAMEQLGFKAQ
jgi:putative NADPH-quinone reductase